MYRLPVAFSLATVTVSTALSLIPPAATKFVVEYVLAGRPLPDIVPPWVPRDRWLLLLSIATAAFLITVVQRGIHIWGRWQAFRSVKLFQTSLRRRVFAHVVRLPIHRVHELKSGGAASILRRDVKQRRRTNHWDVLRPLAEHRPFDRQLPTPRVDRLAHGVRGSRARTGCLFWLIACGSIGSGHRTASFRRSARESMQ